MLSFTLSSPSTVNLHLAGVTNTAELSLQNASGGGIAYAAATTQGDGSIIQNLTAGTYYVDVEAPGINYQTSYSVSLSAIQSSAGTSNIDNAGDTAATASIGALGTATQTFVDWVGPSDTDDFYSFTLSNPSTVNLHLAGVTNTAELSLQNASGGSIANAAATAQGDGSIIQNLTAGTYYVDVEAPGINYQTSYSVSLSAIQSSAGTSNIDNAGDTAATAHSIGALGTATQTFVDWVGPSDTDDFYSFTLSSPSTVNLHLAGVTNTAELSLQNASGGSIANAAATTQGDGSIIQNLTAGTYYVDVEAPGTNYQTSYSVSLGIATLAVSSASINNAGDTAATAHSIGALGTATQTFVDWVGPSDTNDFYSFTLSSPSTVNLQLAGVTSAASFILLNASGTGMSGSSASTANDGSSIQDLAAGTYYVDVSPGSSSGTSYSLTLSAVAHSADNAGSTVATAYPLDLSVGQPAHLPSATADYVALVAVPAVASQAEMMG